MFAGHQINAKLKEHLQFASESIIQMTAPSNFV